MLVGSRLAQGREPPSVVCERLNAGVIQPAAHSAIDRP